ncbi:endonuclease/exonuclease/phosphatase family protein [Wenxinia marina]|uniref:Exonuclease III n=1 Tax=Wenxinia marina DSM 24838 TaxID=1123501 RepID=A0A0D0PB81_9RHOB|nr:endonuclease/exonuclease/phosphatase family protein [Wenxinia marina]KIQ68671.1 Exonuclease III [Wenxinia marina DSM 24838]GGL67813.1 endonuclease [Wenxinia marina]
MRLATYNVEWFDHLFDESGRLLADGGRSGREGVTRAEQAEGLAAVFGALDADAILVVEAPDIGRRRDGRAALEGFAAHAGLRARRVLAGFANDTQQELMLLYDPDVLSARHDPRGWPPGRPGAGSPRFDGTLDVDLDIDGRPDAVRWSKPPLEAELTVRASGRVVRLIGVHAKSKAPTGARGRDTVMRLAIENRRKQMAQAVWLRARVEEHLSAGDSLIVAGDFNDGPGLDAYERLFGRSSLEIVAGEGDALRLFDPHAREVRGNPTTAQPASARFALPGGARWLSAMLDYLMVSEDLAALAPVWTIWHPFDHRPCYEDAALRQALLHASDHFPVTLDIAL